MNGMSRAKLATKYIFFELVPVFVMGIIVFIFVLMMFQSFKLSEYIIVQGADFDTTVKILLYMTLQYLPILIPIALLFSVLLTYGRLSGDSEIVAMKALGLSTWHLATPPLVLGVLVTALSLQISFKVAPWGEKNKNVLIDQLAQMQPGVTIREGVFSEGFFKLVVYANKITDSGILKQVFIYDERDRDAPITIISSEGQIINQSTYEGNRAFLRLKDGNLHRSTLESYTKIDFASYDISLFAPHKVRDRGGSPDSMNIEELKAELEKPGLAGKRLMNLLLEYNRRWALAFTSLVFALIGMVLGTVTNRRAARSGSLVISISIIVIYWILYIGFESAARSGLLPIGIACWMANLIFFIFGAQQFWKLSKI